MLFVLLALGVALTVADRARAVPGVDYVVIMDAPGGAGSWVAGRGLAFGDSDTLWAAGFNTTSGWVEDVSVNWSVTVLENPPYMGNAVFLLNTSSGPSVELRTAGRGVARLDIEYAVFFPPGRPPLANATGPFHVSVDNVDGVVVRTASGGGGEWAGPRSFLAGESLPLYAAAYNATAGYLGDITSNWTSSDPSVGVAGGVWEASSGFGALRGGVAFASAFPVGTALSNSTGLFTVIEIDSLHILDAPGGTGSWVSGRTYMFGDNDRFWAAGYNSSLGYIKDLDASWECTWLPQVAPPLLMIPGQGGSLGVLTNAQGSTYVRAEWYGPNKRLWNTTGRLVVSADNVDSVVIRFEPGGKGTWFGDIVARSWDRFPAYPAAYNQTAGYLGEIASNWSASDPNVVIVSKYDGGYCENGTGNPLCPPFAFLRAMFTGSSTVTATPVGMAITNTTGVITVIEVTVDYLVIRDAPDGGGSVVGPRTYHAGEQDTFYAAAYNRTFGYLGDTYVDWTTSDPTVCEIDLYFPGHMRGPFAQVLMGSPGSCEVTIGWGVPSPVNTTGTLTVLPRTRVTVDDSGGADFTTIQDAVDFALDGYRIYVYNGTYDEHVVVTKELEIEGEWKQDAYRQTVVLDGGGAGTALLISADRVVLHNLTIQNASYGVYNDRTNDTRIYDDVIQDYHTGLYNNRTRNAWVANNRVAGGEIGIVAMEAFDDAIRWNSIQFNSVFGAKAYNARLMNGFNWNYFKLNRVGYYYDPTEDPPPTEFDRNVLEDNDIGVKVEGSSALRVTNNTISGGSEGVQLLNSSSGVRANAISDVGEGVRFCNSSSDIVGNVIAAADVGVVGDGGAPRIEGNDITASSGDAIVLRGLDGGIVRDNIVHGGAIRISDSRLDVLDADDGVIILENTTVDTLLLGPDAEVWWVARMRAADAGSISLLGSVILPGSVDMGYVSSPASLATRSMGSARTAEPNLHASKAAFDCPRTTRVAEA